MQCVASRCISAPMQPLYKFSLGAAAGVKKYERTRRSSTIVRSCCICTLGTDPLRSIEDHSMCVCESYIGKPIGTRAVPQFTTGVAKPLTQIEPGKTEHHPPV